ncbi:hypothetical protein [Aeromonas hydrophila]|uniref:hypothetical protein n=1 Tax=Aeromonas hydrophila TaxID=644 RepID=UPI001FC89341|nr:hypothetical protein [Aeromonas hydrophila]GKQ96536.1 hypothetical protein KAM461_07860 [Aeromonas hydrophila]
MKTMVIYTLGLLLSVLIATCAAEHMKIADLAPVISTLQNISAAVFTISGIWIAYIYPEAIIAFTSPDKVSLLNGTESTKRIKELVLVIISSSVVLISTLVYNLGFAFFIGLDFVLANKTIFKIIGASFICFISFVQIKALWSIMLSNIMFVDKLYGLKTEREVDEDL